ncbi:hypothetical protein DL768_008056 [Monosporascus sp. mg162]|nr:hypothetical protein DL768_008056 [Monosporascus sp. mg162]
MFNFFKSGFFNFEFIRVLGTAPFGGAEIAECLEVAQQIKNDDPESWYCAWLGQARAAETLANEASSTGDRIAARNAFLRCSNYYRAAQYMFNGHSSTPEPRILQLFEKSVKNFRHAVPLLDIEVRELSIPYENGNTLPGYLYLPPPQRRLAGKIPVLVNCGGADSTQEELYALYPAAGTERGYAVLTYDGPGQGIVLRRDKLIMRPDWEVVVKYVLDHLHSLPSELNLDFTRVAIAGASMGGYYALRGAADPRVAACVSIDPIYDMWDLATDRLPRSFINAWMAGWLSDGLFNTAWRALSYLNFQLRWEMMHCMWIFGVPSAALAMREMRRWTLRGNNEENAYLSVVHCPVLVSGADGTIYTPPEISTLRIMKDLAHLPNEHKERHATYHGSYDMKSPVTEPIAIIGTGCRFPGAASSPSKLWELLCQPKDLSRKVPLSRFNPDTFYHSQSTHHGTTNVKNAYVLEEDHRYFDSQFFQTKPIEANSMDPQQRILLETVYEAVDAAGLKLEQVQGTNTAVYVGVMGGDYSDMLLRDRDSIPTYMSTGTARSILSNRISYFFDWHGPSMTIDTACSSSLVAVRQAALALQNGVTAMAVVAGANLILGPENFIAESKLQMLSPAGRCRMWDASADGYARGDGFAVVILKRLANAINDGDDIECVIRGSGVNQDGRTRGITMPSSQSQTALISQVYANAGLDVRRMTDHCQYFEAHGTGTPTGDPIEAAAISEAFFNTSDPADQETSPMLEIPSTLTAWPAIPDGAPRRASINSFGFGGTNAHVILESYTSDSTSAATENNVFSLLPFNFSALTAESLKRYIEAYVEYLNANPSVSTYNLAYTLACRRSEFPYKVSIGALSVSSLKAEMIEILGKGEPIGIQSVSVKSGGLLGIFTGQGAQWAGMCRELILSSKFVSDIISKLEGYLRELPALDRPTWSLREELLATTSDSRLDEAVLAQPLCTAVQIVLVDLLRAAKVKLAAVVGHSSGEIAAAYAAGYLSDRHALYISYYRGFHARLSNGPNSERGAMMVVGTTIEDAQDLCDFPEMQGRLSVAAVNSQSSVTLSGDEDAIAEAKIVFEDEGKFTRMLKVEKAYHSAHMNACSSSYITSLVNCKIKVQSLPDEGIPWFSSVYGDLLPPDCCSLKDMYWNKNMVQPVLFFQAIKSAVQQEEIPYAIAIEIGPHPALKEPMLQSMEAAGAGRIPYQGMLQRGGNSIETVSTALGFIWAHLGQEAIDFEALLSHAALRPTLLKGLPSYPWDHHRIYWHESRISGAYRTMSTPVHELLGTMLPDSTKQELRWRNLILPKEVPWLRDHRLQGATVFPAAAYVTMASEASTFIKDMSCIKTIDVLNLAIERPITFDDDDATGVETLFTLTNITESSHGIGVVSANFKCFAASHRSSSMLLTASGCLRLDLSTPSPTALPLRTRSPPNLLNVDTNRFYSSLADIGYRYTGLFRGLSGMQRKLGIVKGRVANPANTHPGQPLLVHPAMLDSAFQSMFCAYSWPGDGQLFSLHVPNRIARVRINVNLACTALRQPGELPIDCVLTPSASSPIHGDIEIYPLHPPGEPCHALIQVEGLNAVPISAPKMADDRKLFEDVIWGPAEPRTSDGTHGTTESGLLASVVTQITFRYPHLAILEFANAAEAPTQNILREIRDAFQSYTIARPSLRQAEMTREKINNHERIGFVSLEIHSNILSQRFEPQSYGLLIASGLCQDVDQFESALSQLRRLLRPGGYLLLSQELVFQRPSSDNPTQLTSISCDEILRRVGFSGTNDIKNMGRMSLLISQAVDSRILALRKPLESTWPATASRRAVILAGTSQNLVRIVDGLEAILCRYFKSVAVIYAADGVHSNTIPSGATLVSLVDLDEPIFKDLTTTKLNLLKRVFNESMTVLWVTKGCLADDPYANMIVGFGRTLLLETSYLQLQFLDVDTVLPVTSEMLAESLLRLQATHEWSSEENESDLVWTNEPELAVAKNGRLTIPRILPNPDRNDRYNSGRREIVKELNVRSSTVQVEFRESSSSYVLIDSSVSSFAQPPYCTNMVEINVRYSCLLALKVEGVGYMFIVLGYTVDTGQRVLAISEKQASRIRVPWEWCVSCHEETTEEIEASFLSSVATNLYAIALFSYCKPGDVILFYEAPPTLEAALVEIARDKHIGIYFLNSATDTTCLVTKQGQATRCYLPPYVSSRFIKSLLPSNISVFVTNTSPSNEEIGGIQTQIASCLSHFHRRINFWMLWSRVSVTMSSSLSEGTDIGEQLRFAISHLAKSPLKGSTVVDVRRLTELPDLSEIIVVSWLGAATVPITLERVDAKALFANDKTYLLFGLAGDLGQSLAQWMVQHGARHVVLTSRNPRIDKQWLDDFDITDRSALKQVVEEVTATLPPIAGIANGAMVIEDTPVAEMTLEKMEKVLRPKVQGSVHLDELFGDMTLDFFIFFSSVAAVVGNRGQSSYSAANAFMSSLAAQRRARGLAASVIHIGAVVGTGYLTREVSQGTQDYLRKAGYMWMSETEFHQVFAEGVLASSPASGRSHEIISGLNMGKDVEESAVWYGNPKFQHCIIGQDDIRPLEGKSKQGLPLKVEIASATSPGEALRIVTSAFTTMLQKTLLLGAHVDILDQTADSLGIDSLVAVKVRSWFSKELNVDLPLMKILGGATNSDLLEYAVERLPLDTSPSKSYENGLLGDIDESRGTELGFTGSSPTQVDTSEASETEISEPASWTSFESMENNDGRTSMKVLPLSFSQSRFWFLQSFLEDKTTSNVTCLLLLRGPLNIAGLDRAVRVVGERHEGLRTSFEDLNGKPSQIIHPTSILKLEVKVISSNMEVTAEFKRMEQHVFDLRTGDTMRIILLQHSPELHHLIVSYHHINMDGVSFQVLVADLAEAYSGNKLCQPVLQYPSFSEQQRMRFNTGKLRDQIAYWRREYSQLPEPLPILPLSRITSRKSMTSYGFHKASTRINMALRKRMQEFCREQKATAFHFYVTTFAVLLMRLAKVEDLSVGIADAGRTGDGEFSSVGNYLNILPLRLRPISWHSFAETLQETKRKVHAALANAAVPIDVLFSELGVGRSTLHNPLFQVFVDYRRVQETQKFGNCQIEGRDYSVGRTGYDIVLDVIDNTVGDSSLSIMVQKGLYTEEDAGLMLDSFLELTSSFCDGTSLDLQAPSLYGQGRIDEAIKLGRGREFCPRWQTLTHAVEAISRKCPSHTALRDGLGNTLTYEEMLDRVARISKALYEARCPIEQGSRVAVLQEPGVDWVCSMLAIMRVGAAYVPLDPNYGLPRLKLIVYESKPSAVLIHSRTVDQAAVFGFNGKITATINIDALDRHQAPIEVPIRSASRSPAIIMHTSGSTGTPKGIVLSHGAIQSHVEGCISIWGINNCEVVLQQSPYGFDLSVFEIYLALLTVGTLYIVSREDRGDAPAITNIIAKEGITVACGVPSEIMSWLQYGDCDLLRKSTLRMMVAGGEPFSTLLVHELRALGKNDLKAMNIYGPTEATISATYFEVRYNDDPELLEQPAPAGYSMPNYTIYILDENMKSVPAGIPGHIAIAGPISSGYVNNSELQKARFVSDPIAPSESKEREWNAMYLSGDRGYLRSSDGALIFQGRMAGDTQIKLRGFRIELQDIESNIVTAANGAIARAVCSHHGDPSEFLVAHITFVPGHGLSRGEQVDFLENLRRSLPLPHYMLPTVIVPLDAMPLTISGKLDRRRIRELPLPELHHHTTLSPTRELNPIETLLKGMWHAVFSDNEVPLPGPIDAESDFFQVGGNSLLLVSLQAKIREVSGIKLPLIQLFEASSLASMATRVYDTAPVNMAGNSRHGINWESETSVDNLDVGDYYSTSATHVPGTVGSVGPLSTFSPGKVVILTGATGFLGRHILSYLLANPSVERVHCVAVRNPSSLDSFRNHGRITVYSGKLDAPRLGLSQVESRQVFRDADTIIHNGADVSFLKTYASLRASNVASTKEMVRMFLAYRGSRVDPSPSISSFHYISTVGVAQLNHNLPELAPASVSWFQPPPNVAEGYIATKWASERFLERLVARLENQDPSARREGLLRVVIHRPSSVTGPDAPRKMDIIQNFLHYCRQLNAVPEDIGDVWQGWIDLVDVRMVAEGITRQVFDSHDTRESNPRDEE